MAKVILSNVDGSQEEYAGRAQSAGATDAGEFVALGTDGKLDPSLFPTGIGQDALTITAGEDLAAGDFVRVDATGNVVKAVATSLATRAQGYVKDAVLSGQPATVFFDDEVSGLAGLTPGARYFLSAATAGAITTTAPVANDEIVQVIGFAINATTLYVDIQEQPLIRKV